MQTLIIDTDSPYLSKGWPLFRRPKLPITYRVRLGRRFEPPADVRAFTLELERYYTDELAGALQSTWLAKAQPPCTHPASKAPMIRSSRLHLVLIPSYNPGRKVFETVEGGARSQWTPVWVVVDGSTDGTGEKLMRLAQEDRGLRVLVRPKNFRQGCGGIIWLASCGGGGLLPRTRHGLRRLSIPRSGSRASWLHHRLRPRRWCSASRCSMRTRHGCA